MPEHSTLEESIPSSHHLEKRTHLPIDDTHPLPITEKIKKPKIEIRFKSILNLREAVRKETHSGK
jgi:hypothetical protein